MAKSKITKKQAREFALVIAIHLLRGEIDNPTDFQQILLEEVGAVWTEQDKITAALEELRDLLIRKHKRSDSTSKES
jgi:hypothetical protein